MSEIIDIAIKVWNAYSKYKENKENIDLFRILVKFSDLNADKFIESILIRIIPTILENEKKEEKIKREITKYCIAIPKVIKEMGYSDVFPELKEKKEKLLNKLREYEKMSKEDLIDCFSEDISKINDEVKSKDGKKLTEIREKFKNHMQTFVLKQEPIFNFSNYQEYQSYIDKTKDVFYGVTGTMIDIQDHFGYYIDSTVSRMISEYIPYPEKKISGIIEVEPEYEKFE